MNLRYLIYMNPLTVDKISKKFLYEKDSGFLYTRQLISSLPINHRFTILVPKGVEREFFSASHNIELVEYDYSTSIHQNRYHFNRNIIAKALPYSVDIDVVINMQPEVAENLRVFFENQRREKPIIINYYHWIDCEESRKYGDGGFIHRQVEGYNAADLNMFHNQYAHNLFKKSCADNRLYYDVKPVEYFHPQPTTYGTNEISLPDKKIILFNHRLNRTTGWKKVLDICSKLDRDDFVLWFTDESNLKERAKLEEYPFVKVQSIPFESYGYLLSRAHFSVCNLQEYATWNMAVLDSINHGTQVISNKTDLMEALGANTNLDIEDTLDTPKVIPRNRVHQDFNILPFIEKTIAGRIEGKTPAKYELVHEHIENSESVEKREWVNKFWSFHANSNFQIIRWILLSSFNDNTSERLTTYRQL